MKFTNIVSIHEQGLRHIEEDYAEAQREISDLKYEVKRLKEANRQLAERVKTLHEFSGKFIDENMALKRWAGIDRRTLVGQAFETAMEAEDKFERGDYEQWWYNVGLANGYLCGAEFIEQSQREITTTKANR